MRAKQICVEFEFDKSHLWNGSLYLFQAMASPEDNTCVIRMKRDFREFMTNKSLGTSHHSGMSGLQFDMDVSGETQQPTTMQQLFGEHINSLWPSDAIDLGQYWLR